MRLVWILLLLVFAAAGAIFGALNGESTVYDFYFVTFAAPKGAMLVVAVLLGWLLGGAFVYFGLVLRLRAQARGMNQADDAKPGSALVPPPADGRH
jgi:uncharacterized integral membrane protein